jgi:hypothetical protein
MNLDMRHQLHVALALSVCMMASVTVVRAQPGPDRRTFYRTRVQHNPDASEQLRAITELRRQVADTADPVNTRQRHPTRMKLQREALFLNFLCYLHEAQLGALNACALEQGLKNYAHLVALGPWEGYPSPKEQQEAHAQAKDLQRIICHQVFVQNGNRLEGIPAKACGCNAVINSMLTQADEQRRAEAADRTTYREAARKDSIGRVELARNAELSMAIYAQDGRLRIDTTMRLATTAIDSLNRVLLAAMIHAAGSMFRTGPDAATDWELLASVLQKGRPLLWVQRMRKKGNLFELERVSTGDPGSHFRLKILSDLYLQQVAHFLKDGEVLVVPYRVTLDPTLSGTNMRIQPSDGYVNIVLRPIPEVRKD